MQKYLYISKIIELALNPLRSRSLSKGHMLHCATLHMRFAHATRFAMINVQLIMHKYLLSKST